MTISPDSPLVSTDWLQDHLNDPDLRILNCSMILQPKDDGSYSFISGVDLWKEGHIPNSIYVDVGSELSNQNAPVSLMMPTPEILAETLREKGIGDGTAVVCYDHGNHAWAARVWWMLRVCGFENAAVLDGGWKKWTDENRVISTEDTSYAPAAVFTVNPRPGLMVSKEVVHAASESGESLLLHSLPLPSFTGESGPGRIPGSRNLYCGTLIDPDTNTYVTCEVMQEKFSSTGSLEAEHVITYCGGGIAASSNALALTLLGHGNISVYDGSLSEWTADPAMPMEKD